MGHGEGSRSGAAPGGEGTGRTRLGDRWKALSRAQKGLAAVGTAAALAVVGWTVNAAMPKIVDWINPPLEPAVASRLLIVDTSGSMAGRGQAKFDAAVAEIERYAKNVPDVALALRTAGGSCTEGYRDPPVGFGSRNVDEIRAELEAARPHGEANIVSQLEQATNDFQNFELAKTAKIQSIWLFLATARDCRNTDVSLGQAIKEALTDSPAKVSYVNFFVLRGDKTSYRNLEKSLHALGSEFAVRRVADQTEMRDSLEEADQGQRPSD
jgi:von Willebrand factor type A domain